MAGVDTADKSAPTDGVSDLMRRVGGAVALVTALLAFFGIQDAALDRVVRNEPEWTILATLLLIGGVVLSAAVLALTKSRRTLVSALVLSSLMVGVGFVAALYFSVTSKATKERPKAQAALTAADGLATVTFSGSAGGLTSRETLRIELEGLHSSEFVYRQVIGRDGSREDHDEVPFGKRDASDPTEEFVTRLTYAFVGPNAEGVAEYEGSFVLPLGTYERVRVVVDVLADPGLMEEAVDERTRCSREALKRACVALALPSPALRPRLVASLTAGDAPVVSSAVVMKDLPATDLVVVTVHQDVGLDWKMLATHELTPDQAGRVEETVTAAVSPGSRLCIMATRIHRPVAAEDASGTEESTPIPPSPGNPPSCVGGTSSVVTEMLVSGGSPPSETHG